MNKKILNEPVIFVAGILERMENNTKKILLQTRWKPETGPLYSGLLEIPGGSINEYENIFNAIEREVKEECGLKIIKYRNSFRGELMDVDQFEKTMIFQPSICQQVLNDNDGKLWFGFIFICEVEGQPKIQKDETKDPKWVSLSELEKLLNEHREKIFPHQYQALRYYVENMK